MPTPPPQLPPNSAQDLVIDNNYNPAQVQYVTPSKNTSNLNQDQSATGTGFSNVDNSPQFIDQGLQQNYQINSGRGANSQSCVEGVGCKTITHLELSAYYINSGASSELDNFVSNQASSHAYGGEISVKVPLGGGFDGNLDKLVEERVAEAKNENVIRQQQIIAQGLQNDDRLLTMCGKLANENNGRRLYIDPNKASQSMARIHAMCQGVQIASANTQTSYQPNNNDQIRQLIEENNRLREQLNRSSQNRPVRGLW